MGLIVIGMFIGFWIGFFTSGLLKKELYDAHVKDKYDVLFVLDDRDQVVNMWRNELGLACFQVANGNF